jgi:NAD(P)-dependent dehydrogenase (short-subunit alcohol dehydrogenase family)
MEAGLRLHWIVQVDVGAAMVRALAAEGAAVAAGARRKERLDELVREGVVGRRENMTPDRVSSMVSFTGPFGANIRVTYFLGSPRGRLR